VSLYPNWVGIAGGVRLVSIGDITVNPGVPPVVVMGAQPDRAVMAAPPAVTIAPAADGLVVVNPDAEVSLGP